MKDWQRAEEFWAKKFGSGRRQPGSGNKSGAPGDVRYVERIQFSCDFKGLLESKQSEKSISVSEHWLDKIQHEALALGRVPLFGMIFRHQKWLSLPHWIISTEEDDDEL